MNSSLWGPGALNEDGARLRLWDWNNYCCGKNM